jgi:pyridoxal phosphate enzyme (YggS family)
MNKIDDNLHKVIERIISAAKEAGRHPDEIALIAVSKTQPAEALARAYAAGQRRFGENYVQEALEKRAALSHLQEVEWHFIGPIQSNKTRALAENFDWVHTIDREKIARRLNEQRPLQLPPVNVCLQINLDGEDTKSGTSLDQLQELALAVNQLPRLRLRGLMTIPAPRTRIEEQRQTFARLRLALESLKSHPELNHLDTLSMGMSGDLEAAVAEGATLVRVGTDVFGARAPGAAG